MSEDIVILMIGVSTLLGALGLAALIWAVRSGQFEDSNKFVDAVHYDNEDDLNSAVLLAEKRKAYKENKRKQSEHKSKDIVIK